MSHFLERLTYLSRRREPFADGLGELRDEDRMWEEGYRQRWQHDKIVRSTHGVNCTGACSWKIYVKSGVVTWEMQQTDYPRTRPGMPNHEPRGCSRGASYSWYLYSASRIKYPMVRGRLVKAWREARKTLAPVDAWAAIVGDTRTTTSYKSMRGRGGFVRSTWDEVSEIIAAANVNTIKSWGPDRVVGFSPIPAMSMVSYASGARYLSLIGGTLLSFYDWYCDLPPSSPQTWGEQTDVPESADWYNSGYIIAWGSNVPQTRTPDAHFFVEVPVQRHQSRGDHARLFGSRQTFRSLATPQTGHRRGIRDGHGPCDSYVSSSSTGRCLTSRTTPAVTPTCRCWCGCGKTANAGCPIVMCVRAICPVRRNRIAPPGRPSRRQKTPETSSRPRGRSVIAGRPKMRSRGAGISSPRMARPARTFGSR